MAETSQLKTDIEQLNAALHELGRENQSLQVGNRQFAMSNQNERVCLPKRPIDCENLHFGVVFPLDQYCREFNSCYVFHLVFILPRNHKENFDQQKTLMDCTVSQSSLAHNYPMPILFVDQNNESTVPQMG